LKRKKIENKNLNDFKELNKHNHIINNFDNNNKNNKNNNNNNNDYNNIDKNLNDFTIPYNKKENDDLKVIFNKKNKNKTDSTDVNEVPKFIENSIAIGTEEENNKNINNVNIYNNKSNNISNNNNKNDNNKSNNISNNNNNNNNNKNNFFLKNINTCESKQLLNEKISFMNKIKECQKNDSFKFEDLKLNTTYCKFEGRNDVNNFEECLLQQLENKNRKNDNNNEINNNNKNNNKFNNINNNNNNQINNINNNNYDNKKNNNIINNFNLNINNNNDINNNNNKNNYNSSTNNNKNIETELEEKDDDLIGYPLRRPPPGWDLMGPHQSVS
jgi:hypothetical protein